MEQDMLQVDGDIRARTGNWEHYPAESHLVELAISWAITARQRQRGNANPDKRIIVQHDQRQDCSFSTRSLQEFLLRGTGPPPTLPYQLVHQETTVRANCCFLFQNVLQHFTHLCGFSLI
jgi:hypothetical protein